MHLRYQIENTVVHSGAFYNGLKTNIASLIGAKFETIHTASQGAVGQLFKNRLEKNFRGWIAGFNPACQLTN